MINPLGKGTLALNREVKAVAPETPLRIRRTLSAFEHKLVRTASSEFDLSFDVGVCYDLTYAVSCVR